jgi:hypothetical protein
MIWLPLALQLSVVSPLSPAAGTVPALAAAESPGPEAGAPQGKKARRVSFLQQMKMLIQRVVAQSQKKKESGFYPDIFMDSREFRMIHRSPCRYKKGFVFLIRKSHKLRKNEELVIQYGLLHLPLKSYKSFAEVVIKYFKKGVISENMLNGVVFPHINHKPEWYLSYQTRPVGGFYRNLLAQAEKSEKMAAFLSDNRQTRIAEILDGRAATEVEQGIGWGQIKAPKLPAPRRCR